jgi:NAD-dependent deacetylase
MSADNASDQVRERLLKVSALTVLTGAGVSADSGVPTFRGKDGLWNNFRAEDLATPEAFSRDPFLVWEWYNWRRQLIGTKSPNAAHAALVTLESQIPRFTLITQNVDGLHARAGSRNLVEIHGNIWNTRCLECGEVRHATDIPLKIPPKCAKCKGLLRPDVVWFGEALDSIRIQTSMRALQDCELLLVIGTSGMVQPAASFAGIARSAGAFIVEVNLDPAGEKGPADIFLQGRAAEILPGLLSPSA